MRYDHFGMLPLRAFRKSPVTGQILSLEGGKGGDAPDPPNYEALAREQAAGNLELARLTTVANRPDEITPLGTRTWRQGGGPAYFDQSGYDAAVAAYNTKAQQARQQQTVYPSNWGNSFNYNKPADIGPAPSRDAFMVSTGNPDKWTSSINLSPQGQRLFDSDLAMKQKYADLANAGFSQVEGSLRNLGLDESRLVQNPINPGQSVMEAYQSRYEPMFDRQREALETQLANQGIFRGSKAWENAVDEIGRQQNDARIQAAMQSIAQSLQARQAGVQEQFAIQDRPLNLTNALRTGAQVQLPQFQAFAQQNQVAGPDLMGAGVNQYNAGLDAYNIKAGQSNSFMNGLFGLGGAYLAGGNPLPFGG